MEDTARLAVIEQNARDPELLIKTLAKLLEYIQHICKYPHNPDFKNIKSNSLSKSFEIVGFSDYLKYLGFEINGKEIHFPDILSLEKLRIAEVAIERKLQLVNNNQVIILSKPSQYALISEKKHKLATIDILKAFTKNPFLLHLEDLFNDVMKYEDEEMQKLAREHIPVVSLQVKAIDRVREHQLKLKNGEATTSLSYDMALLMELLSWFKHSFFTWVDKPECEECGGETRFVREGRAVVDGEQCRVEHYKCTSCDGGASFPRLRSCRALLASRRGRCGEWADCFTLLCRALSFDTRFVKDTTDHVWCEIFDHESKRWYHADPCEDALDTPLIYEHGWGKKLEYIIAVSRDDIQDVTWRYTSNHRAVLQRRKQCTETELILSLLALREAKQKQVTEARRKYLAKRCLDELIELMVERKPSDYESRGRISGSKEWRTQRGEIGKAGHTFEITKPGNITIKYYTAIDKYKVYTDNVEEGIVKSWAGGAFEFRNIFRKEEKDWRMVYLARETGETEGSISWSISARTKGLRFESVTVTANTKLYENGNILWKIKFDCDDPIVVEFKDNNYIVTRNFTDLVITAELCGGSGNVAYQHAQLFRQSLDAKCSELEIQLSAVLSS